MASIADRALNRNRSSRLVLFALVSAALLLLAWAVYTYLPGGWDWAMYTQPAALELLHGRTPYSVPGFLYPFWILLPLLPLALLPAQVGTTVFFVLGLLTYAYVAYKLGAKPVSLLFILFSFPITAGLYNGQLEWLAILGLVLPKPLGLFLLLSKPQTGLGVALFWFIEAWREGGWRQALRVFAPVSVAIGLSFLLFGLWPLYGIQRIGGGFNASFWPYSLPFGLALLFYSLYRRKQAPAMIASPLLSPYLTPHTWSIFILGLLPNQVLVILGFVASWLVKILLW